VNDAAALARADVGIAMGAAGSEVALQAADVALLSEDMERLADAHRLSRRASRVIRQNLVFAIGAMVVLVTGGLFFDLPLPLAVIGHEGGTVLVVLNGLRLLSDPIRRPVPVPPDHQQRPAGAQDDGRRVRALFGRHQYEIGDTGGGHDRLGRRHCFAAPFRLDPVCRQMEERGAGLLHALCERFGGAKPDEPRARAGCQIDGGLRYRLERPVDIEIDENGSINHA
jgi:hypothetical protein